MLYVITPEQWQRIPDAYKTTIDGRKACFVCFLTSVYTCPGSTLCFEGLHFKIEEKHRAFTEIEEHNGGYALDCLASPEPKALHDAGRVKVYEYDGDKTGPMCRMTLYAYQWGKEYAEDLTEHELEARLMQLEEYEAGVFVTPLDKPGCYTVKGEEL